MSGSHELTIDVALLYDIVVDDGEVDESCAHKGFGTPRPYSTNSEDDNTNGGKTMHDVGAKYGHGALE